MEKGKRKSFLISKLWPKKKIQKNMKKTFGKDRKHVLFVFISYKSRNGVYFETFQKQLHKKQQVQQGTNENNIDITQFVSISSCKY